MGNTIFIILCRSRRGLSSVAPLDTFTDLSVVSPWLEFHPQHGVALPDTSPRLFKSHMPFELHAGFHADASTAPRHLVLLRSPFALPASWLDFAFDDSVGRDCVAARNPAVRAAAFHRFVQRTFLPGGDMPVMGSWFAHVRGWTEPARANMFVLFYEDVVADLAGTTRAIAQFLRVDDAKVTDEVVDRVAAACDRDAMVADSRFQCGVEARAFNIPGLWKAKAAVVEGSFKQFEFSDAEKEAVATAMQAELGCSTYEELKAKIKAAQADTFQR